MSSIRSRTALLRFVFPSICASLGTWQVFRWRQKLELLRQFEKQQSSAPKHIESIAEIDSETQKYQISGVKSTGQQLLLGPRGNSSIRGGYASLLFESVQLPNEDMVVLNRGWVPRGQEPYVKQLDTDSLVLVKDSEERKPLFGRSAQIYWKDWSTLARFFNLPSPAFLKVISSADSATRTQYTLIPHTLSTNSIPNRHLEYILTWYSLASFSFFMSFLKK